MSRWVTHTTAILEKSVRSVPMKAGVYAFYKEGELVYVGSSKMLKSRFTAYTNSWEVWGVDVIKYKLSRRKGDWLMWEYRLIERLRPSMNRRKGTVKVQEILQPKPFSSLGHNTAEASARGEDEIPTPPFEALSEDKFVRLELMKEAIKQAKRERMGLLE